MSRGRKPRVERPEPSRKQLMAAAIDCFARLGYQGTTIDRIARDAGVTKGAVYYHFRDKEELLFEAVKDRIGGFEQHVLEKVKVTPAPDALTRLREVAPEAAAAVIMGGIIGAEVQHYQDPEEIDLRRVLDTLVEQVSAWLATASSGTGVAVSGGNRAW